ncbi:hypothetical protein SDRG_00671 [Saprolegnia diclina VS20]|uniref:Uncharacterized protein n=1 Tax=Saprolegnia diclina (strain VS20) TaxID=1156394 RepID=T0SFN0_SAPDV|nr:hypothetical protein SDRG_00671 [Saprolegnia diclina VS20]EQC41812.1 hypothetical protein SDRG_00671 [Saprolegnia diclina VS20]|eukprot:XP_008604381.1 hypothetical protein SDRG_00671 [Saprolegnia diclina VS20]
MQSVHPAPTQHMLARAVIHIKLSKLFLVASVVFSCSIVFAPLKAYLTEPLPWTLPPTFNTSLKALAMTIPPRYINATTGAYHYDATFFVDVYRYTVPLVNRTCLETLVHIAASSFFGAGMRDAICSFAASTNDSMVYCQDNLLFSTHISSACVWGVRHAGGLAFYYATIPRFNVGQVVAKLLFRVIITLYASAQIYRSYYRHYASLFETLRHHGDANVVRYVVYLGDPTSVILSDGFVSSCFVIDIYLSTNCVVGGILRLSQIDDFGQLTLGALYTSRLVWMAFFGMRYSTLVIKRLRWEHRVIGLDSTLMMALAFFASTGIVLLVANTPLMVFYHWCNDVGASSPDTVELAVSIVYMTLCIASIPLLVAYTWVTANRWRVLKRVSTTRVSSLHLSQSFKQRVLFFCEFCFMTIPPDKLRGGSLYRFCALNPRLRRLPLVGFESADCFVDAYDVHGKLLYRMRLSLISVALGTGRVLIEDAAGSLRLLPGNELNGFWSLALTTTLTSKDVVARIRHGRCTSPWLL